MQAYKLQGKIDDSGKLIISEVIDLPAGDVEIILLQPINSHNLSEPVPNGTATSTTPRQVNCKIASLQAWFEKTEPAPSNFDPDQAKWEYLKEKHGL